jgi:hypothetical protein
MNVGSSLTNDDIAGDHRLTVSGLYAKTLGFAVTAVLGRTDTFFMSEKLQAKTNHGNSSVKI